MRLASNSSETGDLSQRKAAHLDICIDASRSVEGGRSRYDEISFVHRALPEVDADSVSTGGSLFNMAVQMPLFISSMTGGAADAYRINRLLAEAARELGIAVGMGSIRILLRKPEVRPHFELKKIAGTSPVFANIGGVQIAKEEHDTLFRLIDDLAVDGMAIHLNPGQELFQDGGDRDFRAILDGIERFCRRSPVPTVVKETGFGIDPATVRVLLDRGVHAVDLAGSGGTNWILVEAERDADPSPVAREFADWGIPTALIQVALGRGQTGIFASGGIRSGMDVAKAVALGAEGAGMALPFIRAVARDGVQGAVSLGRSIREVVRTVMVLTGARDLATFRTVPLRIAQTLRRDAAELTDALDLSGPVEYSGRHDHG